MIDDEIKEVEKPKKRHTGLIVFIVLISGIMMGAGGCYYYFFYMNKPDNKCNTSKTVKKDLFENQDLDVDSVFVKDLVSRYDEYALSSSEIYDNLYKSDINSTKDMDSNIKNAIAYKNIGLSIYNSFTNDELNDQYVKLFGDKDSMKEEDFSYGCGVFKYDKVEKKYKYSPSAGCASENDNSSLVRKILKAKIKDNNVYINVAVGIKKVNDKNNKEINILNRDGVIEDVDGTSFDIDKDYNKLDKVQYKFMYDAGNRNFYLVSIKSYGI